ncbi:hypothetical protein, partial [Chromohalobacter canadensis]|uniref:hypothetical protein n=1 Tax=Chromohalobacter canadensis TaxID=141389 RepID=UPI0035E7DA63
GPRQVLIAQENYLKMFLSARPVRAATWDEGVRATGAFGFYPRDPCGPRLPVYNSLSDKTKSL